MKRLLLALVCAAPSHRRAKAPSVSRVPHRRPSRSSPATTGSGDSRCSPSWPRVSAAPSTTIAGAIWSKAARDRHAQRPRGVPAEGDVPVAWQSESRPTWSTSLLMEHELRTQLEAAGLSEPRAARVAVRRRAQRGVQRRRSDAGADGQGLREHHHAAARPADPTSISRSR